MLRSILFAVLGGGVAFGFHRLVGCRSGACPIWANPYISILYGALLGFLVSR